MATGFNTQVGNGEYRLQFETDNREYYLLMQSTARRCVDGAHMTNADHIRAMSDEELAEFIKNIKVRAALCKAVKNNDAFEELCSAEWLRQPAEQKAIIKL